MNEREASENGLSPPPSRSLPLPPFGWKVGTHVDNPVLSELLRKSFCNLIPSDCNEKEERESE